MYIHTPDTLAGFQTELAKLADRLRQPTAIDEKNLHGLPRILDAAIGDLVAIYQASERRVVEAAESYPRKTAPAKSELRALLSPENISAELEKLEPDNLAAIRHGLRAFRADFNISAGQAHIRIEINTIPYAIVEIIRQENTAQETILRELLNTLDLIIETCTRIIRVKKSAAIEARLAELNRPETRRLKCAISELLKSGKSAYESKILRALDAALVAFANVKLAHYIKTSPIGNLVITIFERNGRKVVPYPLQVAIPKLARALGEEDGRTEIEQFLRHVLELPNAIPPRDANQEETLREELELRLEAIGL